jgi:hypothetical protein
MRFINLKFFALIACLFMGNGASAYTWGFSNNTQKTLVIGFGLMAAGPWWFNIVKPGRRVVFSWGVPSIYAGFCMGGAEWIEYDPNIKIPGITQNGGFDLYEPGGTTLPRGGKFGRVYDVYFPRRKSIELVYIPDEVYDKTVEAAANLGGGFDKLLCNVFAVVKVVNKGQCPSLLSAIINWIGGLIGTGSCSSREIAIYPDSQGNPIFTTLRN